MTIVSRDPHILEMNSPGLFSILAFNGVLKNLIEFEKENENKRLGATLLIVIGLYLVGSSLVKVLVENYIYTIFCY